MGFDVYSCPDTGMLFFVFDFTDLWQNLGILELMERGSLHDLLHDETINFSGDIILTILRDVVQGLRFLHAAR